MHALVDLGSKGFLVAKDNVGCTVVQGKVGRINSHPPRTQVPESSGSLSPPSNADSVTWPGLSRSSSSATMSRDLAIRFCQVERDASSSMDYLTTRKRNSNNDSGGTLLYGGLGETDASVSIPHSPVPMRQFHQLRFTPPHTERTPSSVIRHAI